MTLRYSDLTTFQKLSNLTHNISINYKDVIVRVDCMIRRGGECSRGGLLAQAGSSFHLTLSDK